MTELVRDPVDAHDSRIGGPTGKKTRQFNFTTTTQDSDSVKLTEHDAHLWADRTQQQQVSSAVLSVLATWREAIA